MTMTPRGLMPAPPTAIDADGNLVKPAMQQIVRHLIAGGASGLVPLGGTGEFTALSPETRVACVEACVEAAGGAPVYAGVLAPGLGEALPTARAFRAAGADGIMLIVPYYARATQATVIDYFRKVRDTVDLPIMLYDNPARSHFIMDPDSIAILAEEGTINSMKASNTDLYHFDQIMRRVGPEFAALSGFDTIFAQQVSMGACGGVLTSAVLVPEAWVRVQALAEAGDFAAALAGQRQLIPLMDALFAEENPGPTREALRQIGIETGQSLLPIPPVSGGLCARIATVLADLRAAGHSLPAAA
ncbi:dihydrodipicolinate synthase family protein [Rhodobacter sp. 24-YEA-8]|uniref:dihydrodipicolinate synthase family protein n=1 Tax=Rhodobacter sp. 24-YEA-8 TaxID=1884310 RepID=UPI00089A57EB|nr:dihydrodipicolinate synthase family protein [Rhodobacter sp. 24-YEA-8]SED74418.1 4-hydroxy-tetrahydrodipicolinate synthase [Rhodobacter sp. 24-YEA-8]